MNFYGHLVGGVAVGAGITAIGYMTNQLPELGGVLPEAGPALSPSVVSAVVIFMMTCFMSLFPDLDTTSIPQRWFYRFIYAVLIGLIVIDRLDIFSIVALLALAPIIHKHRGWTHSRITPWIVGALILLALEYYQIRHSLMMSFSVHHTLSFYRSNWLLFIACVAGHYGHLYLDSK